MNQVQPRARHGAHAPDIAGILRYFWIVENDVEHEHSVRDCEKRTSPDDTCAILCRFEQTL